MCDCDQITKANSSYAAGEMGTNERNCKMQAVFGRHRKTDAEMKKAFSELFYSSFSTWFVASVAL